MQCLSLGGFTLIKLLTNSRPWVRLKDDKKKKWNDLNSHPCSDSRDVCIWKTQTTVKTCDGRMEEPRETQDITVNTDIDICN